MSNLEPTGLQHLNLFFKGFPINIFGFYHLANFFPCHRGSVQMEVADVAFRFGKTMPNVM